MFPLQFAKTQIQVNGYTILYGQAVMRTRCTTFLWLLSVSGALTMKI